MIRVMLVDDHRVVRQSVAAAINEVKRNIRVVAQAGNAAEAEAQIRSHYFDVVLMDIGLPEMDGIEATRRLLKIRPRLKVIGFSMHTDSPYPQAFLSAGAAGYISKFASVEETIEAINRVYKGGNYVSADVARNIVNGAADSPDITMRLTPRERRVMAMLTRGHTVEEIAQCLCLTHSTVNVHRRHLLAKLNVKNDVQLTRLMLRLGFGIMD